MNRCTIVIPTVSTRVDMRARAIASVRGQAEPTDVVVVEDEAFRGRFRVGGAAETRNRGIEKVQTEWTGFLDDDDELYPNHVSSCLALAGELEADLVYPWWDGANEDLFRVPHKGQMVSPEGLPFDDELRDVMLGDYEWQHGHDIRNFIPVTVLVKTQLLQDLGGFPVPGTDDWPHRNGEDHALWTRLLRAGAKFVHLPQRTWRYHLHGKHLSGA